MQPTFLEKIMAKTRDAMHQRREGFDRLSLEESARQERTNRLPHSLFGALSRKDRINIVAEIKRASPSKGVINDKINVGHQAAAYELGGAAAISVLTEPAYFQGSLEDLKLARAAVALPILRKDFIVDEIQILEAAASGADAVLLIVAGLERNELERLRRTAENDLGMDALVEVHTRAEIETALSAEARIIGVNNRDLHTLNVSLDVSRDLIKYKPEDVLMIAESGITKQGHIGELRDLGFDAFLVGESLMRSADAAETLEAWT